MPAPPGQGGAPAAPAPAPAAPVEETGPVFLDEEPGAAAPDELHGARPEPASAWGADASRQAGFGGEQDQRVSWGSPQQGAPQQAPQNTQAPGAPQPDPRAGQQAPAAEPVEPAEQPAPAAPPAGNERRDGTVMMRAARPGAGAPRNDGDRAPARQAETPQPPAEQADGHTVMVRRPRPAASGGAAAGGAASAQPGPAAQAPVADGTMAIRALPANAARPAPAQGGGYGYPPQQGTPGVPAQPANSGSGYGYPPPAAAAAASSPMAVAGPGGGAASWPQQVQQLAQGGGEAQGQAQAGAPAPIRPVTVDPFLAAAQAAAAARPAGLGRRLLARLIDTIVLVAVVGGAAFPFVGKTLDHIDDKIEAAKQSGLKTTVWLLDGTTSVTLGVVLGVLLVFGVLYEALPTSKWGRTLGKKLCKIEVRDIEEYAPPTFGAALRRWFVYVVPGLLVVGVLGVLWCLWDRPWKQCWHDKAARTFVAG